MPATTSPWRPRWPPRWSTSCGWARTPPTPTARASAASPWTIDRDDAAARRCVAQLRALESRLPRRGHHHRSRSRPHGALYEEVAKGGAVYEAFRDAVRDSVAATPRSGAAVGLPRHGDGAARRHDRVRGGVLRPCLPARRRAGRPGHGPARSSTTRRRRRPRRSAWPAARWWPTTAASSRCGWTRCASTATRPARWPSRTAVRQALADVRHRRGRPGTCMTRSVPVGEVRPLGDRAFLIGVADAAAARAARRRAHRRAGRPVLRSRWCAASPRCGRRTGRCRARRSTRWPPPWPAPWARARPTPDPGPAECDGGRGRLVTVPCAFDGPDLAEVAAATGCRPPRWWPRSPPARSPSP